MSQVVYYPLTSSQLSIWYTEKMYPGTSIANIAGTVKFKDDMDTDLLEKAINLLIKNNDAMRLHICLDDNGNPQQYVSDYEYKKIEVKNFSNSANPSKEMFEWDSRETLRPFEILNNDLYRFTLLKLNDSEIGIFANFHHIISDAWSMSISSSLIVKYYNLLKNPNDNNSETTPSYISYIKNEQEYLMSERYQKDKMYWTQQFDISPEITLLKNRSTTQVSSISKRKTFIVPKKLSNLLRDYCTLNKISPYPLFISALAMYINRVTEKEDIIIGTPILNRLNKTEKSTVGMFIDTIPLRINIKSDESFSSFSRNVLELCSSAYRHQRFPYTHLLKTVREKHNINDNIFDIVLSYQNTKFEKDLDINYATRWHFNSHQSNSLTIHINDRDNEGTLIIDYDYHSNLYYDKEIEFIHQHMLSLLWHALDNPNNNIYKIEMLPESEKKKILFDFNNTYKEYPRDKTIHQLFEEQAERTPDNVAIIFEDKQLTYRELNHRANSLARVLRKKGLKSDDVIGVMVSRSIEMVIGILAILKAGGSYLYIEPTLPNERIKFMLADCSIKIILTEKNLVHKINNYISIIDLLDNEIYILSSHNLSIILNSSNLAYLIFTSGSTGKPKAVMIEHKSVVNFLYSVNGLVGITSSDTVIAMAVASFDIFIFELFSTLTSGAKLILTSDGERTNSEKLYGIFKKYKIDIVHGTPAVINMLLEYNNSIFNSVKTFIIGGEQFTNNLLSLLRQKTKARIFNGYGPTECTVGVTFKELTQSSNINIGKPINNTRILILDKYKNLVPIGIPGEICITGDCLGRGYFDQIELTKDKFIINPFNSNERLYKTGDLGKWYSKGEIKFLGRIDCQIKINGHRIELNEIRSQLVKIEGIKDAIVIEQTINNKKRTLCAYYVADRVYSFDYIIQYLSKFLPDYMIPSYVANIAEIPLTTNGKIDNSKLPKPYVKISNSMFIMPQNDIEKGIQEICESVLNIKHISVEDNILELGGDSLDIITISSMIYKKFNAEIPVTTFKENDTIRKIAQFIDKKANTNDFSDELCLLKKGEKNIFFIHAGNGEIENYIKLSELISNEYSCWGIRMAFNQFHPQNISIEDQAIKYAEYITKIQPEGPYNVAGWCIGGTIAFEIAKLFESKNERINFLGLFNSIAPHDWGDLNYFTPAGEIMFTKNTMKLNLLDGKYNSLEIEEIWDHIIKDLKSNDNHVFDLKKSIPQDIAKIIPKFEYSSIDDIIRYLNGIRTLHVARAFYFPKDRVNSSINYFNALEDTIIYNKERNISIWSSYCKKIYTYDIEADHYSLFKSPAVYDIANIINNRLEYGEVNKELNV